MKSENDNKVTRRIGEMDFLHISHVSGPNFRCTYILTSAIILWCQKWISLKVKVQIGMFKCTGIMAKTCPSLYTKYYPTTVLCDTRNAQ